MKRLLLVGCLFGIGCTPGMVYNQGAGTQYGSNTGYQVGGMIGSMIGRSTPGTQWGSYAGSYGSIIGQVAGMFAGMMMDSDPSQNPELTCRCADGSCYYDRYRHVCIQTTPYRGPGP